MKSAWYCFDRTYEGLKRLSLGLGDRPKGRFDRTYEGLKRLLELPEARGLPVGF